METSYTMNEKLFEEYDLKRKKMVSEKIKKYVLGKLTALGWPMWEGNMIIGWHFNFAVIDFVHKPSEYFSILTPIETWERGKPDLEIDRQLEKFFSRH